MDEKTRQALQDVALIGSIVTRNGIVWVFQIIDLFSRRINASAEEILAEAAEQNKKTYFDLVPNTKIPKEAGE